MPLAPPANLPVPVWQPVQAVLQPLCLSLHSTPRSSYPCFSEAIWILRHAALPFSLRPSAREQASKQACPAASVPPACCLVLSFMVHSLHIPASSFQGRFLVQPFAGQSYHPDLCPT